jgi:hypothetical protein
VTNYPLASSFNMPFTTMNNYNWLFDSTATLDVGLAPKSRPLEMSSSTMKVHSGFPRMAEQQVIVNHFSEPDTFPEFEMPGSNGAVSWGSIPQATVYQQHTMSGEQATTRPAGSRIAPSRTHASPDTTRRQHAYSEANSEPPPPIKNSSTPSSRIAASGSEVPPQTNIDFQDDILRASSESFIASTLNAHPAMPTIDNDSRGRILDLLIAARPLMPAGIDVRADNPLLSLSSMQTCLDLFFSRFNVVYPLLHKPTFDPAKTETFLLLAVLLLGATYSDKEMHMLAVCIHDTLRAQIFQHPEFTAQPELWILQTMLLVECFGKSRAGQKQHDMSHLFHGLLIK